MPCPLRGGFPKSGSLAFPLCFSRFPLFLFNLVFLSPSPPSFIPLSLSSFLFIFSILFPSPILSQPNFLTFLSPLLVISSNPTSHRCPGIPPQTHTTALVPSAAPPSPHHSPSTLCCPLHPHTTAPVPSTVPLDCSPESMYSCSLGYL